jgi:transposase
VVEAGAVVEGASRRTSRRRPPAQVPVAAGCGCPVVCGQDWLSVAPVAGRFSSLAVGASAVPRLARQRGLGADNEDTARTRPSGERAKRLSHRGDHRFAVSQDGAKRGRRGYDAGKKIKGRKRHIAVDTQGNLLAVIVHSAGIQDRVAARAVLMRLFCHFDSITTVFADGGYTGKLIDWAKDMFDYSVKIVKRNEQHLFRVLPKRWIVERTFAWLNWSRRLSKDYELRHDSAETMIYVAFAHQLLRRAT